MSISNYTELQASVGNWMARSDLSGDAADFIMLGEAALNRELDPVETDAALTGVVDSRSIDISALPMDEPIALFIKDSVTSDEMELTPKTDGTFPYQSTSGQPRYWSIDGSNIDFDRPCDQAYSFRFRYSERFALSDSAPTNWLLTNHPDVYLAATLIWGGLFTRDSEIGSTYAQVLDRAVPSIKHKIAQKKRALLTVDRALQDINRRHYYDGSWD